METLSSTKQEDMVDVNLKSTSGGATQSQPQSGGCSCWVRHCFKILSNYALILAVWVFSHLRPRSVKVSLRFFFPSKYFLSVIIFYCIAWEILLGNTWVWRARCRTSIGEFVVSCFHKPMVRLIFFLDSQVQYPLQWYTHWLLWLLFLQVKKWYNGW